MWLLRITYTKMLRNSETVNTCSNKSSEQYYVPLRTIYDIPTLFHADTDLYG